MKKAKSVSATAEKRVVYTHIHLFFVYYVDGVQKIEHKTCNEYDFNITNGGRNLVRPIACARATSPGLGPVFYLTNQNLVLDLGKLLKT